MAENIPRKIDQVLEAGENTVLDSNTVSELLSIPQHQASHMLKDLFEHGHLKKERINLGHQKGIKYDYSISSGGRKRLEWLRKNGRL